jgi:hypothetical protein
VTVTPISPPPGPGAPRDADDPVVRMIIPVGRSAWAIAAGYLGLLAPLLVFAPFALGVGILAVRAIRADRAKHGMGRAVFGIIIGAIFTMLALAIVAERVARRHG